ncbi:hypothetical protein SAMN05192552_10344 [Natrinema hispanicum]|uniref:Uncharacterized protein n=1 Tax=Natrinema hispanicum TaxID=392421 RepID=A0A1G6W3V5_9EURY|nr:hypothetical protein BDK88_3548 [Natrinema hispanicum]SDD60511.1 hypothetical protein SAMN05192552_10344 [Natrinema hispanicum]SEU07742.1 hypothetical protein SAMN04488694_1385 [Natrinema hispanicum]
MYFLFLQSKIESMDRLSTLLIYAFVGFPVLFILFPFGPLGLFLFVYLALLVMVIQSWDDTDESPARINCSQCGAPNELDRDQCKHCNSSLTGQ